MNYIDIALSDASKLASRYFSLFYRSVHVLYTGIHVPRAHEVKYQCVIANRTSQIMKCEQYVIIQKRTDDNMQYGKWY